MSNRDITPLIASFREAARHLWNCHYLPTLTGKNPWDVRDSFDRVSIEMFRSMVLEDLEMESVSLAPAWSDDPTPIPGLFVTSSSISGVPIMINREQSKSSGYWDHPKKQLDPNDAILLLARFFDFDEIGFRDFRYLQVFIISATDPDLAGRWALLDFNYARLSVSELTATL
jgi:hypothetical protein